MGHWIERNIKWAGPVAVIGVVFVAYLAFGVFGVHTLFTDDEVAEDVPEFASGAGASGIESDAMTKEEAEAMNEVMADEGTAVRDETSEPMPMSDVPEIVTTRIGSFVDRSHPGEGLAKIITDGTEQRFLRFEEFQTDNGPDLNVYLSTAPVDAPADRFDDEFVDLGDLKGNIGPQNYELDPTVDLDRFSTVVVWCVRFGVAFTAATLAPAG